MSVGAAQVAALAALPPARRAELIYAEARSELDRELWRAALGDDRGDDGGAKAGAGLVAGITGSHRGSGSVTTSALEALVSQLLEHGAESPAPPAGPMRAPSGYVSAAPAPVAGLGTVTAVASAPAPGLGPNAAHAGVLAAAAGRTGVPAAALAAVVDAEAAKGAGGSWNPLSRNPRSSAAGLGQFLSGTWCGLAETAGTWLNARAREQGWLGADGRVLAAARGRVLAERYDPAAAIQGVADFARSNLDAIARAGVAVEGDARATARIAYLGHHLGPADAVRFLRNKGLGAGRARQLLDAQVGAAASSQRVAAAGGDATDAHRDWLLGYLDRKIRPERFAAADPAA